MRPVPNKVWPLSREGRETIRWAQGLLVALLIASQSGCVTSAVDPNSSSDVTQWYGQGKAVQNSKTNTFSLRAYAKDSQFGRVEVLGPVGMTAALMTWNPQQTQILLPQDRKMFEFTKRSVSLNQVLGLEISVSLLSEVLGDLKISDPRWSCKEQSPDEWKNESSLKLLIESLSREKINQSSVEKCDRKDGVEFVRLRGTDVRFFSGRNAKQASVQFQLLQVRSKVEERADAWSLSVPEGFKTIRK